MFAKKPKTVDAVLSAFTRTLQDLADVANSKEAEADVCDQDIAYLKEQISEREKAREEAVHERQRAYRARDRISELIGVV